MAPHHRLILDPIATTTVTVGPEQRMFSIHKSLLCEYVKYFQSAYSTHLREAQENRFVIDDVDPDIFSILFTWLYNGKIYLNPASPIPLEARVTPQDDLKDVGDRDYEPVDQTSAKNAAFAETRSTGSADEYEYMGSDLSSDNEEYYSLWGDVDDDQLPERGTEQYMFTAVSLSASKSMQAEDLDISQLETLLRLAGDPEFTDNWVDSPPEPMGYEEKWKEVLARKKAEAASAMEGTDGEEDMSLEDTFAILVELYILADRFDIPLLRNEIMDHLETQRQGGPDSLGPHLPPFRVVARAYESVPSRSKLLLWLVHIFAYDWDPDTDSPEDMEERAMLPKEFLLDVLLLNTRRVPRRFDGETAPFHGSGGMCAYHEHTSKEETMLCREGRAVVGEDDEESEGGGEEQEGEDVEMTNSQM